MYVVWIEQRIPTSLVIGSTFVDAQCLITIIATIQVLLMTCDTHCVDS